MDSLPRPRGHQWLPTCSLEIVRCPWCSSNDDKVVDSRAGEDGAVIRRRRECLECSRRFTTFERIEEVPLTVIKRSGLRQPFDRTKLVRGLRAATKNGSLHELQVDALAVDIEEQVRIDVGQEVTTEAIGRAVLDALRTLDGVAYVRFASVHQSFTDAQQLAEAAAEVAGPPAVPRSSTGNVG